MPAFHGHHDDFLYEMQHPPAPQPGEFAQAKQAITIKDNSTGQTYPVRVNCLSRQSHEFSATVAFLADQSLALRSDNFLDWRQIGKERLVGGHGKLRLVQAPNRNAAISSSAPLFPAPPAPGPVARPVLEDA
jgi:hypothetical protein